MNVETRSVYEEVGLVKNGRWLTDEELAAGVGEWCEGWTEAAWPLGSPDVGHMDAAQRLVDPAVGGDGSL
eukprot:CAMPEP_0172191398 /NCGR_PEP_ID=MMETSP1050-20130122/23675_1 /TAXON_ID=233186 /ORGANISM="Cryptomonas curvata, Strain CCAP979/52" /LENGTH=69 /DNA_ID=CAMNT_0012866435 /DNA_START=220 /DNA_END=426 /DNA_ORIENTATION=-